MRIVMLMVAITCATVPGCAGADYHVTDDPRGEVNGRSFEFVTTKADGTEWTFRIRGNALWVAVVEKSKADELGSIQLPPKEKQRLWDLIDRVDVGGRKPGKPDDKHGTVTLRLREPTRSGSHTSYTAYVSRRTDDDDVLALANYLIDLVEKHKGVSPAF